jgi:hypothetical protein
MMATASDKVLEAEARLKGVQQAFDKLRRSLLDRVYASTGAQWCKDSPGNITIGVTAHCQCGRVFTDDVVAIGASLTKG